MSKRRDYPSNRRKAGPRSNPTAKPIETEHSDEQGRWYREQQSNDAKFAAAMDGRSFGGDREQPGTDAPRALSRPVTAVGGSNADWV